MKQNIIYPAIVEGIHNMMYRAGTYQGKQVDKSEIYKIMVQHGGCKLIPETTFKRGYNE